MQHYLLLEHFLANGNKIHDLYMDLPIVKMNYDLNSTTRIWCFLPYINSDTAVASEIRRQFDYQTMFYWKYIPFFKYAEFNSKIGPITVISKFVKIAPNPYNEWGDQKHVPDHI